ncbi:uncharacterized protein [Dermacentor albipictus]|uniref:uncharacterized protein n=1 Tax=Dermacentor albipictus TaxID=60249 RepID=UPI0038FCB9C4
MADLRATLLPTVAPPCDLLTTNMASPPATAAADGTRVPRANYSRSQLDRLEGVFRHKQFLERQEVLQLACQLGITTKQTRTWFQNKRAMLRRRGIRIIGDSYVPNLQPPAGCPGCPGCSNAHPSPLPSPRDTEDSRQLASPAVVPPATTVVCPGLSVQSQILAGNETQPQQSPPSLGSFHTGHDFLAIPQPRWDGRVSRAVPSSAFPALSSGDEQVLSASVQLRPNVAAPWNRQYGSFESLYPTRPPPPPLTSSLSHSAPCVSFGGGQSDRGYVQHQQFGVAAPASTSWQGQPQWPQVQLPQGPPASDVQQQDCWAPATVAAGGASVGVHGNPREPPSWQTGGAGASGSSEGSDVKQLDWWAPATVAAGGASADFHGDACEPPSWQTGGAGASGSSEGSDVKQLDWWAPATVAAGGASADFHGDACEPPSWQTGGAGASGSSKGSDVKQLDWWAPATVAAGGASADFHGDACEPPSWQTGGAGATGSSKGSDVKQLDWWAPATVAAGGVSVGVHGNPREPPSWQTGGAGASGSSEGSDVKQLDWWAPATVAAGGASADFHGDACEPPSWQTGGAGASGSSEGSDVKQLDWWAPATVAAGGASADVHGDAYEPPSWQTGGAGPSTSSEGSDESVPSMSSLTSLVVELGDADIEIERSRHWMNAADA